jgi:hypothetical protein
MSARTPDFYIGISTQNPPTIISIGQTIDGMEEIEVRLDQPDEDTLNVFKEKIDKIVAPIEEPVVVPAPIEEPVVVPAPIEEPVVVPAATNRPTNRPTNRLTNRPTNRPTGPGNTFRNMAGLNAIGNVASSLFGNGGAGKNTKKHKITKRYKNKLIKRRKTKRSKSNRIK